MTEKDYYIKVEQRITDAVKAVIQTPTDEDVLYELLLCGYVAYRSGLGLPHSAVHGAIAKGIKESENND